MNRDVGRRHARLMYPATACETCAATAGLVRHHKNENPCDNSPENIAILCTACHMKLHAAMRRELIAPVACIMCGTQFTPARARRAKLCGDPACLKKSGETAAASRWASHTMNSECLNCGVTFPRTRSRTIQKTCSRRCGNLMAWRNRSGRIAGATGESGTSTRPSEGCQIGTPASAASATGKSRSARRKRSGSSARGEGGES